MPTAQKTSTQQQRWMSDHLDELHEDAGALAHAEADFRRAIHAEERGNGRRVDLMIWASVAFSLILLAVGIALMTSVAQTLAPWLSMLFAVPFAIAACLAFPPIPGYAYVRLGVLYPLSVMVLVAAAAGVFAGSMSTPQALLTVALILGVVSLGAGTTAWCVRTANTGKRFALPVAAFCSGSVLSLAVSILWAYQSM